MNQAFPPKGTTILVQKGTLLKSMHPSRPGPFVAGRTYLVHLNHVLPAREVLVGRITDGRYEAHGDRRELQDLCRQFQIECQGPDDWEAFEKLGQLPEAHQEKGIGRTNVYLVVSPPLARWAGKHGYWVEAPLDSVKIIS